MITSPLIEETQMKFRYNGQDLTGTADQILQQIIDLDLKEYEFRYDGIIYTGTELEIKHKLAHKLQYVTMEIDEGQIFLGEEVSTFNCDVIRTSLISKALSRVALYCLETKNEI